MAIRIERSSPAEDGEELTTVGALAFANDALHSSGLPPDITKAQLRLYQDWRKRLMAERAAAPNRHYFKAIDVETGKIVGLTAWNGPIAEDKQHLDTTTDRYPGIPDFVDKSHYDRLALMFANTRKAVMGDRSDYWFLQSMAVHPDHQGRGIASKLLLDGLENLIDSDGLECYLESSPSGRKLYENAGFVSRAEIPQLEGKYVLAAMVRPAKIKAGANGSIAT